MKKFGLITLLLLSTTGCLGNLSSVHRVLEVSNGEGALIDIKQRAIISSVVPIYDEEGRKIGSETRVCAEASPDALSAYAAELAARADNGKIGAQLATAFQEASSYVGMRTPTIQSLRDASYRLCESYLNNAISAEEYGWQLRRFQRNMVVLAAVEQLTGAVIRVPPITIAMQGQAEAARSLSAITGEKERTDREIATIESETTEEMEKKKDKLAALKLNSEALGAAMANARAVIASGSATATVESPNTPPPSPQYIASVSQDVKDMVRAIVDQDDRGELCFIYLSSLARRAVETSGKRWDDQQLQDICKQYLESQSSNVRGQRPANAQR